MLLGRDPLDPRAIWEDLYVGTAMTGRRGALVHALGALDIALWDICGKAAGVPCWRLWGDAVRDSLTPYASLQPEVSSLDAYIESMVSWGVRARELHAVKCEATFSGPYVHKGLHASDPAVVEVAAAVRRAVGPEPAIMVDVQYAFDSVERALAVAEALADEDVFFLETPLWVDDLAGYAELRRRSPVPIAQGEWLSTRFEFESLVRGGCVDVVQPDIGRVGGFTEALRVCELARSAGLVVVPHAWKTGLSVAAAAQLAMVTPEMPFFECLPAELCESSLRKELVDDGLTFADGKVLPPERPGLGVELDRDALARFAEAARRATSREQPPRTAATHPG
jgi:L-alanine-DL-glutamate epimerase-like enolase superfamily enzyme